MTLSPDVIGYFPLAAPVPVKQRTAETDQIPPLSRDMRMVSVSLPPVRGRPEVKPAQDCFPHAFNRFTRNRSTDSLQPPITNIVTPTIVPVTPTIVPVTPAVPPTLKLAKRLPAPQNIPFIQLPKNPTPPNPYAESSPFNVSTFMNQPSPTSSGDSEAIHSPHSPTNRLHFSLKSLNISNLPPLKRNRRKRQDPQVNNVSLKSREEVISQKNPQLLEKYLVRFPSLKSDQLFMGTVMSTLNKRRRTAWLYTLDFPDNVFCDLNKLSPHDFNLICPGSYIQFKISLNPKPQSVFAADNPEFLDPHTAAFSPIYLCSPSNNIREVEENGVKITIHSYNSNKELINGLKERKKITRDDVERVMLAIDRGLFIPQENRQFAYEDRALPIGTHATISSPHIHALALHLIAMHLEKKEAPKILDVGSGSGFLTFCFAELIRERGGSVIGIDHIPSFIEQTRSIQTNPSFPQQYHDDLASGIVSFEVADGRDGWPAGGPYDAIYVGASAETLPAPLVRQLSPNGLLVISLGLCGGEHRLYHVVRKEDTEDGTPQVRQTPVTAVRMIPLVDREAQESGSAQLQHGHYRQMTVNGQSLIISPSIVPAPDGDLIQVRDMIREGRWDEGRAGRDVGTNEREEKTGEAEENDDIERDDKQKEDEQQKETDESELNKGENKMDEEGMRQRLDVPG
ncbi:putative Protein-L-isoaspartate O-methyltransferase 1 [Blattamonas nauphoetae]|uniref:protein-L-isoaspartate(D-aspartate) O-methyltransferase n=1 Tax=Blattamonas nauphoetae TaxID=2049346 RepID=A0ABQ9YGM0_9EUKA|nr:putative Protein-L-isoaspartate O-methyltransferase 1 [Blattamonas nauphoetae]